MMKAEGGQSVDNESVRRGGGGSYGTQMHDAPNFPCSAFTFFVIELHPAVMDGAPPRKKM